MVLRYRILIPLDFTFGPFTRQLKLLKKDDQRRKLQKEKGKEYVADCRARKKTKIGQEPLVQIVDLPEDLAQSLLTLQESRHRKDSIVGSLWRLLGTTLGGKCAGGSILLGVFLAEERVQNTNAVCVGFGSIFDGMTVPPVYW